MPIRYNQIVIYALYLMIPAIIYSKALITICYGIIGLMALLCFIYRRKIEWAPRLGALTLIGLAIVISGVNSSNTDQWLHHTIVKLPFIITPIAFMALPRVSAQIILRIHLLLLFVLSCSVLPVIGDLILHYEAVIDRISMGQSVHTPIEHVKYSMFISYGIVSGLIWCSFYKDQLSQKAFWFVLGCSTFLFLTLHLLAIRTGLIICYASLGLFGMYYLYKTKFTWVQRSMAIGIVTLFILAMSQTPMIQAKMGYMFYDWKMYTQNGGVQYSDSERLFSLQVGLNLWSEQLFLGTGMGDLWDSCAAIYTANGRSEVINYPHSQLIYLLAGTGILGTGLFLIGYLYPLFRLMSKYSLLLIALYTNYSLSFIVENSMERSISVAFFLLLAIPLIYQEQD